MAKTLKIQKVELDAQVARIVFLGDPHGELATVQEVIANEDDGTTSFACVGDVVGYKDGPTSSALCDFLEEKKIPTTEGNHEDWTDSDGVLFMAPRGSDKKLSWSAKRWIKELPQIVEFYQEGQLICKMVHSIFHPAWDWICKTNVMTVFAQLNNPSLIFTGHSHRPCYYTISNPVKQELFNFLEDKELDINIDEWTLVDAGSLGRPEYTGRTENPMSRQSKYDYGTYAIFDIANFRAQLKRIKKV